MPRHSITITESKAYEYLHGVASSSMSYITSAFFYNNIWGNRNFHAEVLTALAINPIVNKLMGIDRDNPILGFVANVLTVEFVALASRGLEYLTGLSPATSLVLTTGLMVVAHKFAVKNLEERAELQRLHT